MALLIKGGEIVTVGSRAPADIYCEGETITRIGRELDAPPGTEVIDAAGKLVFPGFIDPHVHIYLPFMATFAKDTHETASIAALIGGTTTLSRCAARSQRRCARGLRAVEVEGRREQRLRLRVPHVGHQVRQRD